MWQNRFSQSVLVYNVISTGVRVLTRTQRRNPPRKRYKVRVRRVRLPFREIAASRFALLAMTVAVRVYAAVSHREAQILYRLLFGVVGYYASVFPSGRLPRRALRSSQ